MSELAIPEDSLVAYSVVLNHQLNQVHSINSRAASGELCGDDLLEAVQSMSQKLDEWNGALPQQMHNTAENMEYWSKRGLSTSFIHLHIDHNYFNQLLFYQFLHGSTNQASPTSKCHLFAQKCQHHALELSKTIQLASTTPDTKPLYSLGGHVLTITSTVLLYMFLFSEKEAEKQNARYFLERNFELLTSLRDYWPCLDVSFSRFETFHRICMQSRDDAQFRLDRWMLKFIHEFAEPVKERVDEQQFRDILGS